MVSLNIVSIVLCYCLNYVAGRNAGGVTGVVCL